MIKDGFTINECDKCAYTKIVRNACIIVYLYVDDMLVLGTNIGVLRPLKGCYPTILRYECSWCNFKN